MGKFEIAFGRNVLEEAFRAEVEIQRVYFSGKNDRYFVQDLMRAYGRQLELVHGLPKKIKDQSAQGLAFEYQHDFYVDSFREAEPAVVLLCNHLQDVQNLGALTRTAAAFGVSTIVHENKRSVEMNATALKISAGTAFHVGFMSVSNLTHVIKSLQKRGYQVAGLESGGQNLYQWQPMAPLALVVGAEESGLSRPVAKMMDFSLEIPMRPEVESLNAAQAGGIALSWVHSCLFG